MSGTVWILGAGFSKSLGGPLLDDLFAGWLVKDIRVKFPAFAEQPLADVTSKLVARFEEQQHTLWRDAEDYLDRLESAVEQGRGSDAWTVMTEIMRMNHGLEFVLNSTRRLFAASCSAFLKDCDPGTERWRPYRDWFARIHFNDTIITFNYDGVLEALNDTIREKLWFYLPGEMDASGVPVLKLHGSVDWRRTGGGMFERTGDPFFAVSSPPSEFAIATPGPRKQSLVNELDQLWRKAESSIESARRIVFLGYRFPETDAESRRRLLSAIHRKVGGAFQMQTILGPDTTSDKSRRLEKLLYAASANHPVESLPMYAEDYLTIVSLTE
jgi:hypothetical protein